MKFENNIPIYTVDENNIWQFDLEMESGQITQNMNKTLYNNFGTFPKTNKSNNNYKSSSFSCLFGEVSPSREYYEPSDKLDEWAKFINNGRNKLLKDVKGNAWIIDILDSNVKPNVQLEVIPNTLSFEWVQVNSTTDKGFMSSN